MRAIALLSGGLDSTVNVKRALEDAEVVLALTCDYGQRSARREIEAAAAVASRLRIPHRIIALPWLAEITKTALVDVSKDLPTPSDDDLDSKADATAAAVWVPNRNGVFVSIAAAFAESLDCDAVIVGFNAEEGATFPDNSRAFFDATDAALALSTLKKVRLLCHTLDMSKADVVRFARSIDAPLDLIWPCYGAGAEMCWACESCRRLRRALVQTNNLEWFEEIRRR